MEYDVKKWLSDRGYQTAQGENGLTVRDGTGATYTLDTAGFSQTAGGFSGSGDAIRAALSKSGASGPSGYTPLRNTLAAKGVKVGYDKMADAPIVDGQMLNKNDSRLIKVGDDYWIDEKYAKSFVPEKYENPYENETRSLLSSLINTKFSYNPEKDASLKAAQEEAMLSAKQSANSRGLLGGSTAELMRQRAAQELVPVYEQMAYARFQDDRDAKIQRLSILDSLAANAFREYEGEENLRLSKLKFAEEVQNAADEEALNREKFEKEKADTETENALNQQKLAASIYANQIDKVLAMGTVDAEAAKILGIPEGTLTGEQMQFIASLNEAARLSAEKMAHELLLAEKNNATQMAIATKKGEQASQLSRQEYEQALDRDQKNIDWETEAKIRINQMK